MMDVDWRDVCNEMKCSFARIRWRQLGSFKLRSLSFDDMSDLIAMKHSDAQVGPQDDTLLVKRAIQSYGKVPTASLWRGVSSADLESIMATGKTLTQHSMSFSEDQDKAWQFVESMGDGDVIELLPSNVPLFDLDGFYNAFVCALDGIGASVGIGFFAKKRYGLGYPPEVMALSEWVNAKGIRRPIDLSIDSYEPYSTYVSGELEWLVPNDVVLKRQDGLKFTI